MSDLTGLLLLLGLIYLSECFSKVPEGALILAIPRSGSASVKRAASGPLAHWGLQILNVVPTGRQVVVCPPHIPSVSKEGVAGTVPASSGVSSSKASNSTFVAFAAMSTIRASGTDTLIDGTWRFAAHGNLSAARAASLLTRLHSLPEGARDAAIEAEVHRSFRLESARRLRRVLTHRTFYLRVLSDGLLVFLFVAAPLAVALLGWLTTWRFLLLALLCFLIAILSGFWLVHERLLPGLKGHRLVSLAKMALAPTAAIRAGDALWGEALSTHDPLCLVAAFCDRSHFASAAGLFLRDLKFTPHRPETGQTEAAAVARRQIAQLRGVELTKLAKQLGLGEETLFAAPDPITKEIKAYCPRCLEQYTRAEGPCADCPEVGLVPF